MRQQQGGSLVTQDCASLDTEIPSEKYRLSRIAQPAPLAYLQIHKAKVALNFPTSRAGAGKEKLSAPASRLRLSPWQQETCPTREIAR
jgi:hypothetical protein